MAKVPGALMRGQAPSPLGNTFIIAAVRQLQALQKELRERRRVHNYTISGNLVTAYADTSTKLNLVFHAVKQIKMVEEAALKVEKETAGRMLYEMGIAEELIATILTNMSEEARFLAKMGHPSAERSAHKLNQMSKMLHDYQIEE